MTRCIITCDTENTASYRTRSATKQAKKKRRPRESRWWGFSSEIDLIEGCRDLYSRSKAGGFTDVQGNPEPPLVVERVPPSLRWSGLASAVRLGVIGGERDRLLFSDEAHQAQSRWSMIRSCVDGWTVQSIPNKTSQRWRPYPKARCSDPLPTRGRARDSHAKELMGSWLRFAGAASSIPSNIAEGCGRDGTPNWSLLHYWAVQPVNWNIAFWWTEIWNSFSPTPINNSLTNYRDQTHAHRLGSEADG